MYLARPDRGKAAAVRKHRRPGQPAPMGTGRRDRAAQSAQKQTSLRRERR
jgi:hypothetical protein